MYHSHFFIAALARALHPVLQGSTLRECYSQQKDELVLEFTGSRDASFFIKADLSQGTSIICFPETHSRSRSNSVNLFAELRNREAESVEMVRNDRIFRIHFSGGLCLSFKLFGQRSNIILHNENSVLAVFNHHLRKDLEALPVITAPLPASYQWHPDPEVLKKRCPGFTPRIREYWQQISAETDLMEVESRFWHMTETLFHPERFFICRQDDEVFVSFFAIKTVLFESADPIEICNQYYRLFWQINRFLAEKKKVIRLLNQQIAALHQQSQQLASSSELHGNVNRYRLQADLLMAYGQSLPNGLEKISLPDFDGSGEVEIRLKKDLSINENAERLYRKARGWQDDQIRILKNKELVQKNTEEKAALLKLAESCENLKELRKMVPESMQAAETSDSTLLPYHVLYCMNYEIRIGKNAKSNDELLRISHKDDLWLHARDVPGSHVLVRVKKGTTTPQPVIARAAELAAWHSKAARESVAPVMLTERKYVRKIKGSAAGLVKVEKEKTLLVKPAP